MGKTFLLKNTRLYINQYDMSGLSRSFDNLLKVYERVDMTAWDHGVSRAIGNRCEVGIEGYSALLDIDSDKSADALSEAQDAQVTLLLGDTSAPAVGDLAYIVPGIQFGGLLENLSGAVGFAGINFYPEPTLTGTYYIEPWAYCLEAATARTETLTGASVRDPGQAQTTAGWSAILHIMSTGGDWEIKIQDSANDSDWADITTFTADGSTATVEHKSGIDALDQYVRILATRTSGGLTCVLSIARN